jgi:hypothetical protein
MEKEDLRDHLAPQVQQVLREKKDLRVLQSQVQQAQQALRDQEASLVPLVPKVQQVLKEIL